MRRILSLIMALAIISLSSTGCFKKRQARKTLEGSWVITEYYISANNTCYNYQDFISDYADFGENFGSADFSRRDFTLTLTSDSLVNSACYDDQSILMQGDYKITDHNRVLLIGHEYEIDLDGRNWYLTFQFGEKADGQDFMTLSNQELLGPLSTTQRLVRLQFERLR